VVEFIELIERNERGLEVVDDIKLVGIMDELIEFSELETVEKVGLNNELAETQAVADAESVARHRRENEAVLAAYRAAESQEEDATWQEPGKPSAGGTPAPQSHFLTRHVHSLVYHTAHIHKETKEEEIAEDQSWEGASPKPAPVGAKALLASLFVVFTTYVVFDGWSEFDPSDFEFKLFSFLLSIGLTMTVQCVIRLTVKYHLSARPVSQRLRDAGVDEAVWSDHMRRLEVVQRRHARTCDLGTRASAGCCFWANLPWYLPCCCSESMAWASNCYGCCECCWRCCCCCECWECCCFTCTKCCPGSAGFLGIWWHIYVFLVCPFIPFAATVSCCL